MKRILQTVIFTFIISLLLMMKTFAQNLQTAVINVGQGGNLFSPTSISVNPGDSVSFVWVSGTHSTVADNGGWAIPATAIFQNSTGFVNVKMTSTPGTYTYHCQFHGGTGLSGMSGTIIVSGPAGINDPKESKFEFSAAPNPFEDQLSMNINIGEKNVTDIKIHDIIGKEVASVNLSGKTGLHSYKVDTSNLKPGIYFCTVYSSTGILETKKLFRRN
jgi:plastocyanin